MSLQAMTTSELVERSRLHRGLTRAEAAVFRAKEMGWPVPRWVEREQQCRRPFVAGIWNEWRGERRTG